MTNNGNGSKINVSELRKAIVRKSLLIADENLILTALRELLATKQQDEQLEKLESQ